MNEEMHCPICFSSNVTTWRLIGTTQWYICANGHRFNNPIILATEATLKTEETSTQSE